MSTSIFNFETRQMTKLLSRLGLIRLYFRDGDHLNKLGAKVFSAHFKHFVESTLGGSHDGGANAFVPTAGDSENAYIDSRF